MGKIRTRIIGLEDIEKQQKEEQKQRSLEKKVEKKKATPAQEAAAQAEKALSDEQEVEVTVEKTEKKAEEKKVVTKKHVRGSKYKAALKQVEDKAYTIESAISLLKKIKFANFDESVELHLNVEKTGLKGEVELPHSTGKTTRVAILDDALLEKIDNGVIEFDVLIAHPSFMPKLAKFARVLGPKGLMPNPKTGTVSPNPVEVAKKFEKGTLRWKTEAKFPLVHQMVGKISADEKSLAENVEAFINAVGLKSVKGAFIKTTMSPGVELDLTTIQTV